MARRFMTVDVFTDRPFGGNPLAVVLDAAGLSTAAMQSIAREFNYSETSFVLPPEDPLHHARVRIFTPGQELPFAGHPTIGTGFVLALERLRTGDPVPERFLFEEAAGLVPVRPIRRDDAVTGAELTAPTRFRAGPGFAPDRVARALGLETAEVRTTTHAPSLGSAGLPFLLAEIADAAAVDRATAQRAEIAALIGCNGETAAGLYFYARDSARIHARMFAPLDGIDEDPATGSAAAALGGLLMTLGGPSTIEIAQGVAMGRPSRLVVRSAADGAILVGGDCVPMMRGELAAG